MEDLREKVYECTLPVEAHMICDLLASAGISARVDGEFLAGAGGELPLGNTIRVRVDPARAAEARAVIDEWERAQPPEPTPLLRRSPLPAAVWFALGQLCGALIVFVALRPPESIGAVANRDFNDAGLAEATYKYSGDKLQEALIDRNRDGTHDARYHYDGRGRIARIESDDDFDGRFEWSTTYHDGLPVAANFDSNGDGNPEQVWNFERHAGFNRSGEPQ